MPNDNLNLNLSAEQVRERLKSSEIKEQNCLGNQKMTSLHAELLDMLRVLKEQQPPERSLTGQMMNEEPVINAVARARMRRCTDIIVPLAKVR